MKQAFIGLGSNMGNAYDYLAQARAALQSLPSVTMVAASSLYITEPQGKKNQPWFVNQVVQLGCVDILPERLLDMMLEQESLMGRVRDPHDHFGPRVIDMDLLLFDQEVRSGDPHLILPHPRMTERAFVLIPLLEIAPKQILPDGRSLRELLEKLDYRLEGSSIFQ
jgi:2-amino-4-hydroxy-6-hydroxymethyldihydropteridine diphosphokinase